MRKFIGILFLLAGAMSFAATITVSSPNNGDFLGKNNTVQFNITDSDREVTIDVTATSLNSPGSVITAQRRFSPDADGKINGSIPLNFNEASPQGPYTIRVVATEPGNSYNTVPDINVTVDVRDPKVIDFNPISGSFVGGNVLILASLDEPNVKEWRVKVDGADIPNNSGATQNVQVTWDTSSILTDGSHSIEISIEDLAENKTTRSFQVTLDRRQPTTSILAPLNNSSIRPNSPLAVVVQVSDQFANALDKYSIDVVLKTTDNRFITRVSRRSIRQDGSRMIWTGRVRSTVTLPANFKVVVTAVDKAGNQATLQEVNVKIDGR